MDEEQFFYDRPSVRPSPIEINEGSPFKKLEHFTQCHGDSHGDYHGEVIMWESSSSPPASPSPKLPHWQKRKGNFF